ncbi:MAG: hypothetical protein ACI9HK_004724 [Pirellulaceae bacterium]|jgi:hypothetical protein
MLNVLPRWFRKPSELLAWLQPATAVEIRCFLAIASVTILLATGIRGMTITDWPIDFHLTRQYHGTNIARRIWLQTTGTEPGTAEHRWLENQTRAIIEPPIVESLAAAGYYVSGQEMPWLGAAFTSLFWLAGGYFVFATGRHLSDGIFGGLLATAFYLLSPFGMVVSRSFQPESLMVFAFTIAMWQAVRRPPLESLKNALTFGAIAGIAILVKPGIVFLPLLGLVFLPILMERGIHQVLSTRSTYIVVGLMLVPSVLYVVLCLSHQLDSKLLPQLLLSSEFYTAWLVQVERTIGWVALLAACLGGCLMAGQKRNWSGLGLLAGYVAYAMFFTWHTMTHNYYQAPLVPIIAVCMSPLAELARAGLKKYELVNWARAACAAVLVIAVLRFGLPSLKFVKSTEQQQKREDIYREIGQRVGNGNTVICLSEEYGLPLMHHGWIVTQWWPTAADLRHLAARGVEQESSQMKLRKLIAEHRPSHFVITNMAEFKRQESLRELLNDQYEKLADTKDWVGFRLIRKAPTDAVSLLK